MTTEPLARELERRYKALLAQASRERGNEACLECERFCGCKSSTFGRDSERLAQELKK